MLSEDLCYKLLKLLAEEPQISQRGLASRLGISVGKVNYCMSALVEKGLVKINNFRRANNKLAYAYFLTPRGIEEKATVAVSFLRRKIHEYSQLQQEIEALRLDVLSSLSAQAIAPVVTPAQQQAIGDAS